LTGRIYQQEIYSVVIGTGTDLQCVVVTWPLSSRIRNMSALQAMNLPIVIRYFKVQISLQINSTRGDHSSSKF
jgi:hypothetical protein